MQSINTKRASLFNKTKTCINNSKVICSCHKLWREEDIVLLKAKGLTCLSLKVLWAIGVQDSLVVEVEWEALVVIVEEVSSTISQLGEMCVCACVIKSMQYRLKIVASLQFVGGQKNPVIYAK